MQGTSPQILKRTSTAHVTCMCRQLIISTPGEGKRERDMSVNFSQTRYIPSRLHREGIPERYIVALGVFRHAKFPPPLQSEIPETRLICKELSLSDVDFTV